MLVDFWKACFPDQTLNVEKDEVRSKQWLFLGFESDDPLKDFQRSLPPYMCIQYYKLHKEEFPELVQSRILLGPYDYNFVKAAVDITAEYVSEILVPFSSESGSHFDTHFLWHPRSIS
jgi:hypothetical protein